MFESPGDLERATCELSALARAEGDAPLAVRILGSHSTPVRAWGSWQATEPDEDV